MALAVLKKRLTLGALQLVDMQLGAKVGHVHWQGDGPTIWYETDVAAPMTIRSFSVMATGQTYHPSPDFYRVWLGTTHAPDGTVWHVFEVIKYEA